MVCLQITFWLMPWSIIVTFILKILWRYSSRITGILPIVYLVKASSISLFIILAFFPLQSLCQYLYFSNSRCLIRWVNITITSFFAFSLMLARREFVSYLWSSQVIDGATPKDWPMRFIDTRGNGLLPSLSSRVQCLFSFSR